MLSHKESVIISDDDDEYELPSLAERIKASLLCQNRNDSHPVSSDSEDEDSSFLKFSEKIRNTPCSQVKFVQKETSNSRAEESKISKSITKIFPPPLNIKLDFSATSESEDEESEFLNFSRRIQSTPQIKALGSCYVESDSDSDEVFSNLSVRLNLMTPTTENKDNAVGSEAMKMNKFCTPISPQKKISYKEAVDSESDESFSNFVEILRTPMSMIKKISRKTVDSESDESFSSFVEKLRTPMSINRKIQHKASKTDCDGSFVTSSKEQIFKTPRSQNKIKKDAISISEIMKVKQCQYPLPPEDTPNSSKQYKYENEKEFKAIFHPESISSTFLKKRYSYTHMLYEFYNRKVFNSQLPPDLPLIYDGALKTTAGLTCCAVKNGTYVCSIKLSSSLLNSFERLRDTLLHEMCHAAVWIINKQNNVKHGPLWQIWASRCKLILPFIECPTRCHNFDISYSVWYECPKCHWKKGRCKQVRKYHGALCKRCETPIIMTHT